MIRNPAPLVSVICTTFNRGGLIRPTLQSVLDQSVKNLELIVVSDGSDDDTHIHVKDMAGADDRLTLHVIEHSGIPAVAMNEGLSHARGVYIAYLDHDDVWTDTHLRGLVNEMDAGADLAASGSTWISPRGKVISRRPPAALFWHPDIQVITPVFENSQALHRAELIEETGGWSEGTYGLEDWDMWLRMSDAGAQVRTVARSTVQETIGALNLHRRLERRFGFELLHTPNATAARAALRAMAQPEAARELERRGAQDTLDWYLHLGADARFVFPHGFAPTREAALAAMPQALEDSRLADLKLKDPVRMWMADSDDGVSIICGVDCMSDDHARRYASDLRRALPSYFAGLSEVVGALGSVPETPVAFDALHP